MGRILIFKDIDSDVVFYPPDFTSGFRYKIRKYQYDFWTEENHISNIDGVRYMPLMVSPEEYTSSQPINFSDLCNKLNIPPPQKIKSAID